MEIESERTLFFTSYGHTHFYKFNMYASYELHNE